MLYEKYTSDEGSRIYEMRKRSSFDDVTILNGNIYYYRQTETARGESVRRFSGRSRINIAVAIRVAVGVLVINLLKFLPSYSPGCLIVAFFERAYSSISLNL